ncbi:hypothetical protein BCV72DRAFT_250693 [Rhizopus microsporus var. microsporus]|uniref:Succinylglutamate desuccinylase/Aspartoacylase catalytic domain-containing protein n=1 Tax=Rhizopus microsporus var. microsporus TaxID=86635 RepID=A0A1X0QZY6_RHIZD|nr:hypothetical protein BCV72DRAFT_250693 [Rhizopus microsporus var. microsporus]
MTRTIEEVPKGAILQVDSPEPTLVRVDILKPGATQAWKNGLGKTNEICIYPPEKDYRQDSFFWRLSENVIDSDFMFPMFLGYDCTTVILPTGNKKSVIQLNHRGEEASTRIKPLFPYTLQFLIKKDLGTARFSIDKIGQPISNENGETGRKLILGAFALVYVVEGNVRISLDENSPQGYQGVLKAGQTLCVERDEDASPTSMVIQSSDSTGNVSHRDLEEATVITIQVTESKPKGAPSTIGTMSDYFAINNNNQPTSTANTPAVREDDVPSRRREPRRKGSLVVYDSQPISKENRSSVYLLQGKLESNQLYEPPLFEFRDTDVPPPVVRDRLVIEDFPVHSIHSVWIKMVQQGLGEWLRLPVIVCRGTEDGPVVGITAALRGTVVAVPCVNVSGYLKFTREFADGRDLNRLFPGREDGFSSQVYCYQLMNKVISQFNYLIDLHTASFGRVNSYYVRADMNDSVSAMMARLQQPQIVLHNSGQDGTLRSAASARGIKAITVEIGNPQSFQTQFVQWAYIGTMRILDHLEMYALASQHSTMEGPSSTILCSKGFWIYTKMGGILEVYPNVNTIIRKNDLIARIKNIFGNVVEEYYAPCSGIVIGRSSNPVAMSGDRIIHLGVIKKKNESLPKEAKENY